MPAPARTFGGEEHPLRTAAELFVVVALFTVAAVAGALVVSPLVWLAVRVMEWAVAP